MCAHIVEQYASREHEKRLSLVSSRSASQSVSPVTSAGGSSRKGSSSKSSRYTAAAAAAAVAAATATKDPSRQTTADPDDVLRLDPEAGAPWI